MTNNKLLSKLFSSTGIGQSVRVYIPATIIYRGTSFVRGLILAWLLAQQTGQYSLLTIALQVINILAPLVSLGLNEAITRYTPAYHQRNELKLFLIRASMLLSGITFIACLVLFIFSRPIGDLFFSNNQITIQESISLARASFITIFAITIYFLIASVLKGLRMFLVLSLLELSHGILFLVMALAGVFYISRHAEVVIWSYIFSLIVPTVIFGAMLIKRLGEFESVSPKLSISRLSGQLIGFGFWAAISGIIWQSWQMYSLWYLTKFCDASAGDTFAAARLISQLIIIVGIALSIIVMTSVCVKWEQGDKTQANMLYDFHTKLILLVLLAGGLILVNLRQPLALIFPQKFAGVSEILPQMILFFHLASVLTFLAIHFVLIEKTRLMLWSWLTGLMCNIILAIFWIKGADALTGAVNSACVSAVLPVIVAIVLIFAEKQSISFGLMVIILSSVVLILPSLAGVLVYLCLLIWSILGGQIFSAEQKRIIAAKLSVGS